MESKLDKLAKDYLAYEKTDISDFQRKARILQSMWRVEQGYDAGFYRGKKRGNYLPEEWAKETLNNYLSDTIKQVVREEVIEGCSDKLYSKPRIFNNLLSSQPLCFNLFAELKKDLRLATKVFHSLSPERIGEVVEIDFEHSPGIRNPEYTGDRSAFDVYVLYKTRGGGDGFAGIEVKYHENLNNPPAQIRQRYFDIATGMNCFKESALNRLQDKPLEQIWRDHLLVGSVLQADSFEDGFFVFLYPKDNHHCSQAVKDYKSCLTDCNTFEGWTIEDVVSSIKQHTQEKWIDVLYDRYLDFAKVESFSN